MISSKPTKREVIQKYYKITIAYAAGKSVKGRVNCYICPDCRHVTKTTCLDEGVTPAFFACEKCNGLARTTFFEDVAPEQKPTFAWFRPALNRVLAIRHRDPRLVAHILNGGLHYRRIATKFTDPK